MLFDHNSYSAFKTRKTLLHSKTKKKKKHHPSTKGGYYVYIVNLKVAAPPPPTTIFPPPNQNKARQTSLFNTFECFFINTINLIIFLKIIFSASSLFVKRSLHCTYLKQLLGWGLYYRSRKGQPKLQAFPDKHKGTGTFYGIAFRMKTPFLALLLMKQQPDQSTQHK